MMSAIIKALVSLFGTVMLADVLFNNPLLKAASACLFGFGILFVISILESFISTFTLYHQKCFPWWRIRRNYLTAK